MSSLLRNRFGIPGVIAVIALVFAMVGGAYAAKKYVITSTSQIKPSVLKSLTGTTGATGSPGAKGDSGAVGQTGAAGGQGIAGTPGAPGNPGAPGSPWVAGGVLPPGSTETGTWGEGNKGSTTPRWYQISFGIPLEEAPTPVFVNLNTEVSKAGCPGIVEDIPTADEGKLCVYAQVFESSTFVGVFAPKFDDFFEEWGLEAGEASTTGGVIGVSCSVASCSSVGTWAVTAE